MQRSEQDFAGTNAKVQMALLYVSGFRDHDATLRTALQLLRRKYRLIEHVIATVVCLSDTALTCCRLSLSHSKYSTYQLCPHPACRCSVQVNSALALICHMCNAGLNYKRDRLCWQA